MSNIWNSFEIDCIARDFGYNEYIKLHSQTKQKHSVVTQSGYVRLSDFFYLEMTSKNEKASKD